MKKLNKKYNNLSDLLELAKNNNLEVKRNYTLDTHGTNAMGYIERRGITIDGTEFQVIFTSQGYGTTTQDITEYNGRSLPKHNYYMNEVSRWWYKNFII